MHGVCLLFLTANERVAYNYLIKRGADKMDKLEKLTSEPIFFERNRVYRIYRGGRGIDALFGEDNGKDCYFPEEWIASKVKAINPKYFGPRDGVSVVKGTDVYFDDLLENYPDKLLGGRKYDCLVKYLDSASRLPFQVHPTKEFSEKYFGSSYGKTEAWLVIGTRPGAKLYFGFKDKMTKGRLSELEERSETEKEILGDLLSGVEVKEGDLWLIKAGLVHAIGAGCTIIEVQEPTDFTIQPERWCGDYHISYEEEYIGLEKEVALSAANYDIYGDAAKKYAAVKPRILVDTPEYKKELLIGYDDTPCFSEIRHTLFGGGSFVPNFGPAVFILQKGQIEIIGENYLKTVEQGDYFFLPYAAEGKFEVRAAESAVVIECLPSKQ